MSLSTAAMASGAGVSVAAPTYYKVEVTLQTINFPYLDGGSAQVYGSIMAGAGVAGQNSNGHRNLGHWGFRDDDSCVSWAHPSPSVATMPKCVWNGSTRSFAEAPLCTSDAVNYCLTPYETSRNRIHLKVKAGDTIRVWSQFNDGESGADPVICSEGNDIDVTSTTLPGLDREVRWELPPRSTGACVITYQVRTLGTWSSP